MKRRLFVVVWLAVLFVALATLARTRFVADLSAFLPAHPTAEQRILIDQLSQGPASHLVLIAIEGPASAGLAALSRRTAATLRGDPRFLSVHNGETVDAARDRALLFDHRYLLSDRTTPERFTAAGLHEALADSLELLTSSAGLMLRPLLTHDPTAELVHLVEALTAGRDLPMVDGVWVATSTGYPPHAVLVAETRASGADLDGQQAAIEAIEAAFAQAPGNADARLVLSGPPVFAVRARSTIEHEATVLASIGAILVALLLGSLYRSWIALVLGMLPMISGALCGLAVVAAGFGVVHGITLGFGVTLIGEAVDYAIYLFVQREYEAGATGHGFWSTIALGVATSTIGFAALILSGFEGLAQIGILSIVGLVVAAAVTRWVLPALLPHGFSVPPTPRLGRWLVDAVARAARFRWPIAAIASAVALAATLVVASKGGRPWSTDLGSLSPVAAADQATDARLRSELGAPDVRDLIVIHASDVESALIGSERVVAALGPLITDGTLAGLNAPSLYLPSRATQGERQRALPDPETLRARYAEALQGLPFTKGTAWTGFFDDVERERSGALLSPADLEGTSMAPALRALLGQDQRTGRWTAVVALRSPAPVAGIDPVLPRQRIAALATAVEAGMRSDSAATASVEVRAIDITLETGDLYASYLARAVRMSAFGALAIAVLLGTVLRDAVGLLRVLGPLVLAVAVTAALQLLLVGPMTLFHLVGLLLIVAVGSNYALFLHRRTGTPIADATHDHALLTSLLVANLTAVIGFGVLGLSSLPVLKAIGTTVAPGALLALVFSAAFSATATIAGESR